MPGQSSVPPRMQTSCAARSASLDSA